MFRHARRACNEAARPAGPSRSRGYAGQGRNWRGPALQGFALHAEGSTPNIGSNGGTEKLSARSSLTFFADDGSPTPGSMRMTVPFSAPSEQVDVHRLFSGPGEQENWGGYELIARLKVIDTGTIGDCLAAWVYATSEGFSFGRGAEVSLAGGQWQDLSLDLDAPDVAGSHDDFDETTVNQFGIHVQSNNCP